jgi:hypothetical protein
MTNQQVLSGQQPFGGGASGTNDKAGSIELIALGFTQEQSKKLL